MISPLHKPYTGSATPRPSPDAARDLLKRGYFAQALIDIIAISFGVFFVSTFAVGIAVSVFFVSIEICRAWGAG